jgi:uncharacterized protein YprB with RNaseH-like and TPR domain
MNSAIRLISLLDTVPTMVRIEETADDRFYLARHTLPDDSTEFVVHYFDCEPVVVEFNGHRLNMAGETF